METKICTKCHEEKPIEEFVVNRRGKPDEYRLNYCNKCRHKQINSCRMKSWARFVRHICNRKRTKQKETGLEFSLTQEYLHNLLKIQKYSCAFSGELLNLEGLGREVSSLDRIDNTKGYVEGNVVWVKYKYNIVKNDLTLEEFKKHLPKWYKNVFKILNKMKEIK